MAPAKTVQIVPSLLSADLARLPELLRQVRRGGSRWVTVDVMDGRFVPNLSFGPDFVRAVKRESSLLVDVHLMVTDPQTVAPWFIAAGADLVTFHVEACRRPLKLLRALRGRGVKAGLAVKPGTPEGALLSHLGELDAALVMTVEPGFGGARFLPEMLPKVARLRRAIDAKGLGCWLQVDGGINLETAARAAGAGADSLVSGTGVFGALDAAAAVKAMRESAQAAYGSGI